MDAISGVSTDSRTLREGDLFVALRGPNFDGHDFMDAARQKGASAVVCLRGTPRKSAVCRIEVEDTLRALGDLASFYRSGQKARVIAVTGSNGKTTTKEMIHHVLSGSNRTVKSEGSFNNFIGLPLSVFRLDATCAFAVLEMGTSAAGEISTLSRIARPDIGVVTCICEAHIESFKNLDGVAEAKSEILDGMNGRSILVVNGDDERCNRIAERFSGRRLRFGFDAGADVRCVETKRNGLAVEFRLENGTLCRLPVPGIHNVRNALACIAVCRECGLTDAGIAERLAMFTPPKMRCGISRVGDILLIDDAYNANPASFDAAIEVLVSTEARRMVLVCGDMLELGARSETAHQELGRRAAKAGLDMLVCVGTAAKAAGEAALSGGLPARSVQCFASSADAALRIRDIVRDGDAVLVKGSRAMQMEIITDAIRNRAAEGAVEGSKGMTGSASGRSGGRRQFPGRTALAASRQERRSG
jgi:UDP-N-acetylmuramoyl-tripeptide--D-alanyl-D-alanine ligase